MNALARYCGEEASHRLTRNAVVFFSRHYAIFSQNFQFTNSQSTITFNTKSHTLDVFRCCCQRRSARTRVTVNGCAAIFKPPVPLLHLCYAHTFVHKGLLYHFNRLRTTLAEIEANLDANSLICSFCHFPL